jgi:hypothetical protein
MPVPRSDRCDVRQTEGNFISAKPVCPPGHNRHYRQDRFDALDFAVIIPDDDGVSTQFVALNVRNSENRIRHTRYFAAIHQIDSLLEPLITQWLLADHADAKRHFRT